MSISTLHELMVKDLVFGWQPDVPDKRDLVYSCTAPVEVPDSVTIKCPPVLNQLRVGSCVWNALAIAAQIHMLRQWAGMEKAWLPSRLFGYFNTRAIEGTVMVDSGCRIRDAIKVAARLGLVPESEWPYVETMVFKRPTIDCYNHATRHQVLRYERVPQARNDIMHCLASGWPIIFGAALYTSFLSNEVAKTGDVPMPDLKKEKQEGGHAQLIRGYKTQRGQYHVRGSWSEKWGDKGDCWMPFEYIEDRDLCSDLWTVRWVERVDGEHPTT